MDFVRKIAGFALAAVVAAGSGPAAAVPVRDLYAGTVAVNDQSAAQREKVMRQALETVLVRVTGDRNFASGRGALLLDRPNAFLQGYGYEAVPGGGLQLKARFDSRAVDTALRELGLPVWGINRPSYQAWIVLRDDGQPAALLDAGAATARAAALLATAERRGIPLTFPALDATASRRLDLRALWDGNLSAVREAARRDRPDGVLVVRARRDGASWLGQFSVLRDDGADEEWSRLMPTLEQVLAEGLHELADRQASRFAVQTGFQQDLRLAVEGVDSIEDYARVQDYLRRLNPVRSVFVEAVAGDRVQFRVLVEGDPQLLPRVVAAGSLLQALPGEGGLLRYQLR